MNASTDPFDDKRAAFDLADEHATEALGDVLYPWVPANAAAGSHALKAIVGDLIDAYVVNARNENFPPVDPVVFAGGSTEPFTEQPDDPRPPSPLTEGDFDTAEAKALDALHGVIADARDMPDGVLAVLQTAIEAAICTFSASLGATVN